MPARRSPRRLAELVGQLTVQCDEFATRWARHPVRTCTSGVKRLHHPLVGAMTSASRTSSSRARQDSG
ncbi:hypothetical protein ABZ636_01200 [Streptomyces sp. NPDC007251]|uniref:MmyB family transcriptional regulator n=1 Tax=Streptomyces sp. NPDC007251 TaxID=3154483 RepID=UPI0033F58F9F